MFAFKTTVIFFGMIALTCALPMFQEKRESNPNTVNQFNSHIKNEKFNILNHQLQELLERESGIDESDLNAPLQVEYVVPQVDPMLFYFNADPFEFESFRSKRAERSYGYRPMRG